MRFNANCSPTKIQSQMVICLLKKKTIFLSCKKVVNIKFWRVIENWRHYKVYNCCTVYEQSLSFRGRCKFRIYIKSKPNKYELKIVTFNDARTAYSINQIPNLGKTQTESRKTISEYFFPEVTSPKRVFDIDVIK